MCSVGPSLLIVTRLTGTRDKLEDSAVTVTQAGRGGAHRHGRSRSSKREIDALIAAACQFILDTLRVHGIAFDPPYPFAQPR